MDFSLDESAQAIGELAGQVIGDASTHERLRELEKGDGPRFDRDLWASLAETGRARRVRARGARRRGPGPGRARRRARARRTHRRRGAAVGDARPGRRRRSPSSLPRRSPPRCCRRSPTARRCSPPPGTRTAASRCARPRRPSASGDGWQLTGTKICVPAGAIADAIVVPAAIEGGSVGLFLVRTDAEGVGIEPLRTTLGDPQAAILLADDARRARRRGPRVGAAGPTSAPSRRSAPTPSACSPGRSS